MALSGLDLSIIWIPFTIVLIFGSCPRRYMRRVAVPPFALLMIQFLGFALFDTISGGQVTVMLTDALILVGTLTGAIYVGGAGAIVIGGLYWKRGTPRGAWVAMITGAVLALAGRLAHETWTNGLQTRLVQHTSPATIHDYLLAPADRSPLNAQWLTLYIAIICTVGYVVVSLLTHEAGFDMDRMLHRGRYALEQIAEPSATWKRRFAPGKLIGIDEHCTRGEQFTAMGMIRGNSARMCSA